MVPDTFRLTVRDSRNIILIVGFQAENTLGRRLVKHEEPIRIFGEEHELEAEVHSIQALTAMLTAMRCSSISVTWAPKWIMRSLCTVNSNKTRLWRTR